MSGKNKTGVPLAGVFVLGASILALGNSSAALARDASFMGLADLPGGQLNSRASAITEDGRFIVGWSHGTGQAGGTGQRGVRWDSLTGAITGSTGWNSSGASDISADGLRIVGSASPNIAYRWDFPAGNFRVGGLSLLGGAHGVSSDGNVIVGWRVPAGSSVGHVAFRWSVATGTAMELTSLTSDAIATNADGSVIVGRSATGLGGTQAFRWTTELGLEFLGDLPGGVEFSEAVAVSRDGSIILGNGSPANAEGPNDREAVLWMGDGQMIPLGDLPGGLYGSTAYAMSDDASVVVGSSSGSIGPHSAANIAFIWDAANGMRSLKSVLEVDYGLDLTGWELTAATAVSADGSTIAGYGRFGVNTLGWVAFIPEPGTLSMLLLALPLVVSKFRRVRPECTLGMRA